LPAAKAPEGHSLVKKCPVDTGNPAWKLDLIDQLILHGFNKACSHTQQHGWFVGRVSGTSIAKRVRKEGGLTHEVMYKQFPKGPDARPCYQSVKIPHELTPDTYAVYKWWVCLEELGSV
jgi:hypothetical protein